MRETEMPSQLSRGLGDAGNQAFQRLFAEMREGLRHGYFEYTVTCEVIGNGRRRLQLRAGKNYQFVIPAEDCESAARTGDLPDEGAAEPRS
jgi:hypothetical protein